MGKISSFHTSGERYRSLRIIGALFTLIGAVLLAIGTLLLLFGLYVLLAGTAGDVSHGAGPFTARQPNVVPLVFGLGGIVSLLWSVGVLLSGLQFVAVGALFQLLIHLEENTRVTAQSLDKIRMRMEPRVEGIESLFSS